MKTPAERFLEEVRWFLPCCINCEHWSGSTQHSNKQLGEACMIDPLQRRPPAKTIAFGCPRFVQDVPF